MSAELVPQPRHVARGAGRVPWASPLRVHAAAFREALAVFEEWLRAGGWRVVEVEPADAQLVLVPVEGLGAEGYRLRVDDQTVIEASAGAGAFYGLTVLRQLGPRGWWSGEGESDEALLDRMIVEDAPAFTWRGAHLDVARHFFDVATICRLIDQLAVHRLNRLHLHLNDDQGWRVEIPEWPNLTRVGAWRRSSPIGHERDGLDDGVAHGGSYNAADLAVIRDYASARFIQVVPEIDLPGHAQAVVASYAELGNVDEATEVWCRWGVSPVTLNVGATALLFAEQVVRYVGELFPGSPVHVGGDECPTTQWETSALAYDVMRARGFYSTRELQGLFTTRMALVLADAGHEVVAWDEVLDAEVPPGTVIMVWRDPTKAVEAIRRGYDVVMAPQQWLYFDWLSSDNDDEPVAVHPRPHVTTWERVYGVSVIPEELDPALHSRVRGAQTQLWSEYLATRDQLDYMLFPRLAAFSEVVWGSAGALEQFRPRLDAHLGRLAAMGVRFRPLDAL